MRMSRKAVLKQSKFMQYNFGYLNEEKFVHAWGYGYDGYWDGDLGITLWVDTRCSVLSPSIADRATVYCKFTNLRVGDNVTITCSVEGIGGGDYTDVIIYQPETGTEIMKTSQPRASQAYSFVSDSESIIVAVALGDIQDTWLGCRITQISVNGVPYF